MTHDQIFAEAIQQFGEPCQIVVAIEELSELQKELCKLLRGTYDLDHIAEEIADVEIMLRQIRLILDVGDSVNRWKQRKAQRLWARITRARGEIALSPDRAVPR